MRIDYETICQMAAELGCRRDDLIALSPGNDPFYAHLPSRREAAEWFADLWVRLGFKIGSHPRRLHYTVVSQDPPIRKPNGEPYLNTENDWKYLLTSSLAARYQRLIPDGALADHRNSPPIVNRDLNVAAAPSVSVVNGDGANLNYIIDRRDVMKPFAFPEGFHDSQAFVVEVWAEKSTMNDILVPMATRLGFNFVPGTGETSEVLARQAVSRAHDDGRPVRVLYCSDFDPGGRSMPVALARKIEFWIREADVDLDITLNPVVLTPEQCERYRLPRTPLKETERRAAKFEERFGSGATELDALEALHPGELANIVEAEVCRYLDPTLKSRVSSAKWDFYAKLKRAEEEIKARHDVTEIERRHTEIVDRFEAEIQDLEEKTRRLWPVIAGEIDEAVSQIEVPAVPQPREATPPEAPLFDSRRDYIDQIDHYRAWQGRGGAA